MSTAECPEIASAYGFIEMIRGGSKVNPPPTAQVQFANWTEQTSKLPAPQASTAEVSMTISVSDTDLTACG